MNHYTFTELYTIGLFIGLGIATVPFILAILPPYRKSSLEKNLAELQRRNELLDEQNGILRVIAGGASDIKRTLSESLTFNKKVFNTDPINEEMLKALQSVVDSGGNFSDLLKASDEAREVIAKTKTKEGA